MFVVWLWIKEAIQGLFRNFKWNVTAVFLSTACLMLFAVSYIAGMNAKYFANVLNSKIEMNIDLLESANDYQKIERQLTTNKEVKSVRFVSKEEAYKTVKKEMGKDADILKALDKNPFPARFVVKLKNPNRMDSFAKQVEKLKIAESVEYGKDHVGRLLIFTKMVTKFGYFMTIGAALFTIFVVFTAIQNNIEQRRNEIRIKQLIGAGFFTVRVPFILEAIMLTLISSLLVYGSIYFGIDKLLTSFKEAVPYIEFVDSQKVVNELLLPLLVLGVVIGFIGSVLSTHRNLSKKTRG